MSKLTLFSSIRELGLEKRLYNILELAGIRLVKDLAECTVARICNIRSYEYRDFGNISRALFEHRQLIYPELLELGLDARTFNCLRHAGLRNIKLVTGKTAQDLLQIRGFGQKSLEILLMKLTEKGLSLADNPAGIEPPSQLQILKAKITLLEFRLARAGLDLRQLENGQTRPLELIFLLDQVEQLSEQIAIVSNKLFEAPNT